MTPRTRYLLAAVATLLFNWALLAVLSPAKFHFRWWEEVSSPLNIVEMPLASAPAPAVSPLPGSETPAEETAAVPAMPDLDSTMPTPDALRLPAVSAGEVALTPDLPPAVPLPDPAAGRAGEISQGPQLLEPPDLSAYYPQGARARNLTGFSLIRVSVSAEGGVLTVEVLESSPTGVFDAAARQVGKTLRFRPARIAGKPAAVRTRVKLNWRLD